MNNTDENDEYRDSLKIDNRCPSWFRTELVGLADQAAKCQWWNVIARLTALSRDAQVEFDKCLKDNKEALRK